MLYTVISPVSPAGFQSCFGPISSFYTLFLPFGMEFYSVPLYIGYRQLVFNFIYKGSQPRVCLEFQRRLRTWTGLFRNAKTVKIMGFLEMSFLHFAI